jgi:3-methyladenine DNA glycosylase/8-oxoguanine DNA glycosylase
MSSDQQNLAADVVKTHTGSSQPVTGDSPDKCWLEIESERSLRRTLSAFLYGSSDPTTKLGAGHFARCALTPDGPATLRLTWENDPAPIDACGLDAEAWGPGREWMLAKVDQLTGRHDRWIEFPEAHPVVERSLRLSRHTRMGASGDLYHELLPTIIAQRITGGEAIRQWQRLCFELGEQPPGPPEIVEHMRLPPSPASLYRRPAWWFHPLGIETKRARPLTEVARHADKLWGWAEAGADSASRMLSLIPGVGPWTIGTVLGTAIGDPDAVAVGDYHFANAFAWALASEARATDDRMLELLEPYRGQRGRVLAAVLSISGGAPKFGPKQRLLPMAKW